MGFTILVPPAAELLTPADVEAQLNLGAGEEDEPLLERLIRSARDVAQRITERSIAVTRYAWTEMAWPRSAVLPLPLPPLVSVVSITYANTTGGPQTLSAASYTVNTSGPYGYVGLNDGVWWPEGRLARAGWTVTYDAGYAALADVPGGIVEGMLQLIGHWYANREGVVVGEGVKVSEVPFGIRDLLERERPG